MRRNSPSIERVQNHSELRAGHIYRIGGLEVVADQRVVNNGDSRGAYKRWFFFTMEDVAMKQPAYFRLSENRLGLENFNGSVYASSMFTVPDLIKTGRKISIQSWIGK